MRKYIHLVLALLIFLTGCRIQPIDFNESETSSSVKLTDPDVAHDLLLLMIDQAPVVLYTTAETSTWNDLLSHPELPKEMHMVEAEVAEQLTPAVYQDILNPGEKRPVYYKIVVDKVYWGGLSKNAELIVSSWVECTTGTKIILYFSDQKDISFKTANGSEYQKTVWLSGMPLFVVSYEGTDYVLDVFYTDLAFEMYDRGLQNNTGDAVIYSGIHIVQKDAFEPFLTLREEYQTGKWRKLHSWEMEEGPAKEAEAASEALKVKVIKPD